MFNLPATPFQSHLGTNYVPSESEVTQIDQILHEVNSITTQLDAEVEALKAKRAACASFAASHRALLSPIRKVPSDILINIFLFCLETNKDGRIAACEPPLLFTRVCRQWHDLVIGTPCLWTKILIDIPCCPVVYNPLSPLMRNENEEEEGILDVEDSTGAAVALQWEKEKWQNAIAGKVELVRLWLERGGRSPLSVFFVNEGRTFDDESRELLALACQNVSRWIHLDIFFPDSMGSQHIMTLKGSQAVQLRSLSMKGKGDYTPIDPSQYETATTFPSDSLISAPTLRHLYFDDFPSGAIPSLPVQWSKLTELFFAETRPGSPGCISPSIAVILLQKCPSLVMCELRLTYDILTNTGSIPEEPPRRVLLPHLTRLVVYEDRQNTSQRFFDSLDVPSLHSLGISGSGIVYPYEAVDSGPSVLPLLRRWGDRIRRLEFRSVCPSVADLRKCIQLISSVEDLTIDLESLQVENHSMFTWQDSDPFFKNEVLKWFEVPVMAQDLDGQPLCPNLRSLRLSTHYIGDISAKALTHLVSSRHIHGAHLAKLEDLIVRFSTSHNRQKDRTFDRQWLPPLRWREAKLNAGLSDRVIRVQWSKTHGSGYSPYEFDRPRDPFESWWDHQSYLYSQQEPQS